MKNGDTVQVRRFDTVHYWVFARVVDAATGQVQVAHPGNAEDGKVLVAAEDEIRTKADVERIAAAAQAIASQASNSGLSDSQFRQLAALDPWWNQFLPRQDGKISEGEMKSLATQRVIVHRGIARHYAAIGAQLS